MRTLLIGFSTEKTFRHTIQRMREFRIEVDVLDLSCFADARIDIDIVETPSNLIISMGGDTFDFAGYGSIYNRAYWTDFNSASRNAALSRLVRSIAAWLSLCPGTIVNRPGCGTSNSNKFLHGIQLQKLGFRIPETFVTGDPLQASLLAHEGYELVSKSCSSTRTRTTAVTSSDWSRLGTILHCPTLFQRRIRGDEVRVHYVGGRLFPERIRTHRIDYRFPDPSIPPNQYLDCDVPSDIARLCEKYCTSQALMFAGFDFKIEKDESWVVLEVNPMPGYESYDRRQKNRIVRALADLLSSGQSTPPVPTSRVAGTVWEAQSRESTNDYGSSIYLSTANGREQNISFIGEDRRPATTPFFYPMRLDNLLPVKPKESK